MKKILSLLVCLILCSPVYAGIPGAVYYPTAGSPTIGVLPLNCGGTGGTSIPPPTGLVVNSCRLYTVSDSPYADGSTSGNGTVYFGPCNNLGKYLTQDNGSGTLSVATISEISLSVASGFTSGDIYDVYVYNNSGTQTLDTSVWSGNTPPSRGTDAAGRLTKTGATNELLVGAIYMISSTKTADWQGERLVSNLYNITPKSCLATDSTSSWTYASATIRAANGSSTDGVGRFAFLQCLATQGIAVSSWQSSLPTTGTDAQRTNSGIALDSTITFIASGTTLPGAAGSRSTSACSYSWSAGSLLGYHFVSRNEQVDASTTTFYGSPDNGAVATINN